jgi:acetolactate synthase-1/2/3 large subunit
MQKKGSQVIWEVLLHEGVEVVFGYPGGAILPAYDAMLDYPIRHVLVRHEQGAAHMADGYARASGNPGVAIATSGPGATNLVTGIATAMMDSSPLVVITGQVPSASIGSDAFQETDVTGITLPITKHNYLVARAEDIGPSLKEAFHIARSGRPGPVLVDITKDAQLGTCNYEWSDDATPLPGCRGDLAELPQNLQRAVDLINTSERPLVLAGRGVILSGATSALMELAQKAEIPVAMTLLGLGGFPGTHPLNLGMMGMHGEAWVNQAVQEADLILAFGMRFDDRVTGNVRGFATGARKVHIDIDPSEINKNVKVDVGIVGDLRDLLARIALEVEPNTHKTWLDHIAGLQGEATVRDIQHFPENGRLYAAHVMRDLWHLTQGDALVVTDVGQHQMWEAQYYKHDTPRKLITSGGLGTMGFALPAGIGAKLARPDEDVWVVAGDGGIQMTAAELSTCRQEGIKLNIALINNSHLGMVRQLQEFFYGQRYAASPMCNPDFVKLAEAHGLVGLRVDQRSQIEEAVQTARRDPGTVIIEFRVEKEDTVFPMVPAGADLHAMILRPVAAPSVKYSRS